MSFKKEKLAGLKDSVLEKKLSKEFGNRLEKIVLDDGFVHVHCKSQKVADEVNELYGSESVHDGCQYGSVQVYVNGKLIHNNLYI